MSIQFNSKKMIEIFNETYTQNIPVKFRKSAQKKRITELFKTLVNKYPNSSTDRLKDLFFKEIDNLKNEGGKSGISGPVAHQAKIAFKKISPQDQRVADFNSQFNDVVPLKFQNANGVTKVRLYFKKLTERITEMDWTTPSNALNQFNQGIDDLKDRNTISGPVAYQAKEAFKKAFPQLAAAPLFVKSRDCTKFKLNNEASVRSLYKSLKVQRFSTSFRMEKSLMVGATNVGYKTLQNNPGAKIGVMIAANSGLPGGGLGYHSDSISETDLNLKTQEESVWANAVLTECGNNKKSQANFHSNTIKGVWGMLDSTRGSTNTQTIQGIDFTTATNKMAYNGVYVVKGYQLSWVNVDNTGAKQLSHNTKYPVTFVFADSVNVAPGRSATGSMRRTQNAKAATDYVFFRDCVKTKLRSALDAMANENVDIPLVATLSTGVYADKHQFRIVKDFNTILKEVLEEKVGPQGEKRGQFFRKVIIPQV